MAETCWRRSATVQQEIGPFVIAGQSIQAQVFFDIATGGQQGQESQDPQGASDTEAQYFISFSTGSNKTQNNTDYD